LQNEKNKEEIDEVTKRQAKRLASMCSKIADFAVETFTDWLSEVWGREVLPQEAVRWLDEHADLLDFDLLDEAIANIGDWRITALINGSLRIGGFIIRQREEWVDELRVNGEQLFLQMLSTQRKDLYELLKDEPHLVSFLISYIRYKLRLD
jgi:hypothetical protein